MFVYKVTNLNNNKIYIGITIQKINMRFSHHVYEAKRGSVSYFHRAIIKHSPSSFKVEQIDSAINIQELKEKEIFYIKSLKTTDRKIGYNFSTGGDGSPGNKLSEETKDKIRQKAIGRVKSLEERLKMSETRKGKSVHANTKIAIQKYNLETSKIVLELNENNEIIREYKNMNECAKVLNLDRSGISIFLNKRNGKLYNKKYKLVFAN